MTDFCPVCRSQSLEEILRVDRAPVHVGLIWPTAAAAREAPVGSIVLTVCLGCGFIFNAAFTPAALTYSAEYDIALHHSPRYQAYLEEEVTRLVQSYDIRRRVVVELGCGDGHFLRLICSLGENTGYGFDPSLPVSRVESVDGNTVSFSSELFDSRSEIPPADLVVSRSVLESIVDPVAFLTMLREAVVASPGVVVYIEVPNASWVFSAHKAWNVYYEHCSYFSADLLPRLFAACGFETIVCEPRYDDGQHLCLEARLGKASPEALSASTHGLSDALSAYRASYERAIVDWRARLEALREQGRRVAIWGAGGRGITFLNTVSRNPDDSRAQVAFAVDINPARQGKFLPRTAQRILAPEELTREPVDVLVVTNATYEPEVRAAVDGMGLVCDLLTL